MSRIHITELPKFTFTKLAYPPDPDDLLLIQESPRRTVKRLTVKVLLESIPIKVLLDHILQRLKERQKGL